MKQRLKDNKYFQIGLSVFIVIACSILFYFLIFKLNIIIKYIGILITILSPFIIGFVFAYLLNPLVKVVKKCIFDKFVKNKKHSNNYSILTTILLFLGILILMFSFIIPELLKSIETLALSLPNYLNETKNYLLEKLSAKKELQSIILNNYESINAYLNNFVNTALLPKIEDWLVILSNGVFGAVRVAFNIIMGFVISIYYLSNKETFIAGIKKMIYSIFSTKKANNILDGARHTNNIFGSFLIGKLLDALIIGFTTFLFLTVFGYPYALLIGVLVGTTNMIPYFGPYIGTIPSALLILINNPTKCLVFVLFIIVLQQIDSYIIEPRVCGQKTGLKSFWVLASILFFGNVFGIIGMIIGVPIFALIYGYLKNKIMNRLENKDLPIDTKSYTDLERINVHTNKIVKQKKES